MHNWQTSILSVCDDADLQFTRELVLRSEGYKVVSLRSDHVESEWRLCNFDVGILCRTVDCRRASEIATLLRRSNPCIRLLRIDSVEIQTEGDEQGLHQGEQGLPYGLPHGSLSSPSALLGAVRSLCAPQSNWLM